MTRLCILAGDPTPVELAAVVVALTASTPQPGRPRAAPQLPAWRHAALHEGIGGARMSRPGDLRGNGSRPRP